MKKILLNVFWIFTYLFAAAGVFLIGAFILNKLGLTNVSGIIDHRSQLIKNSVLTGLAPQDPQITVTKNPSLSEIQTDINRLEELKIYKMKNFCRIQILNQIAGNNATDILNTYRENGSNALASNMVNAALLKLSNDSGVSSELSRCENIGKDQLVSDLTIESLPDSNNYNVYSWTQDETWEVLQEALAKDKDVVQRVGSLARVEPRMIMASTFAEQTRMFRTQRGLYKKYLQPLKILASANQFSLGVMGIKPKTAEEIEKHLTDASSPYYLGPEYEHLLDFQTTDHATERYNRLSNEKDHFYSYLYGALYIKQIQKQWADAGYPLDEHPEIVGTLFNIGFQHSEPNPNAQVGGASIKVNNEDYTFGALAYEFYYSGKLASAFPYPAATSPLQIR